MRGVPGREKGRGFPPHAYHRQLVLRLPVQNGEGEHSPECTPAGEAVPRLDCERGHMRGRRAGVCMGSGSALTLCLQGVVWVPLP